MSYREYPPASPLLFGYDPERDLGPHHLARLVDQVVENALGSQMRPAGPGQPAYDPRLCLKILLYGYSTSVRSSRQLERLCHENLGYLFLTRGAAPSYRTICTARLEMKEQLDSVWTSLFCLAHQLGLKRVGRVTLDSTKLRANAGSESVIRAEELSRIRNQLAQILAEAEMIDALEDAEGADVETEIDIDFNSDQFREILRQVRQQMREEKEASGEADPSTDEVQIKRQSKGKRKKVPGEDEGQQTLSLSRRLKPSMRKRLAEGIEALDMAQAHGLRHVSLTDPDARMMPEGCQRRVRECHSLEVAVDEGVIVAASTTQSAHDSSRLLPLVEAARKNEPEGILAVTADSGYYSGDNIASLTLQGVDTCIPDPGSACDLRRGRPAGTSGFRRQEDIIFEYDAQEDAYRCPKGNVLAFAMQRPQNGQQVRVYRARQNCVGCVLAYKCLMQRNAVRRTLKIGANHKILDALRQRFNDPQHRRRYYERGPQVETVFAFIRRTLGYTSWLLRGAQRVAAEAQFITLAYQFRKMQSFMAA